MDKHAAVGGDNIFDYFEEKGQGKLKDYDDLVRPDLLKDGASDEDVVCAKRMAACLIGLIEDVFPQDMDIYMSFYQKRTHPSQCVNVITNDKINKDGFGFYSVGICEAVELQTEEAVAHGAIMSKKTRVLAMVSYVTRTLLRKRKMIEPFKVTDYAYEPDIDLRPILWALNVLSHEINSGQRDPETVAAELDSTAIAILVAKKLDKGRYEAPAIVDLIKRNAPKRVPGTEQPFMLFF